MATLLFYHVTPTDWNPAKSDNEYTMKNDPPIISIAAASSSSSSDSQPTSDEKERVSPSRIGSTSFSRKGDTGINGENDDTTSTALRYSCPATVTPPENLISVDASRSSSGGVTNSMTPHAKLLQNTSAYLSVFHGVEYNEMSFYSYDSVKESMFHWKNTQFGDYLQDGDVIYESGCGIGLNLVLTLEILSEARGIQNLRVYGNDYFAESIRIARELMQPPTHQGQETPGILSSTNGKLGTLCRADSAKLHEFVPVNTFDLVFTGYITPLQDALQLNLSTPEDLDREYRVICQAEKDTTDNNEPTTRTTPSRAADMQRRQEDWFGTLVSEMIRIAKPGAPVIVEQVSYPYCEAFLDGGGVALDFWKIAVERYQWDVNVDSIEFENDSIIKSRYHVAMRKNS
jgi:SAM-dependent methyltransferase